MAVHINEVIIRAIIVGDEKGQAKSETPTPKKGGDGDEQKFEIAELIDEVLKNKKER